MRREETHRTLTVRPFSVRLPSMMVDIAALYRSIGRLTWRAGVVQPERLKHRVLPDGSHRIELYLRADEVRWSPPKYLTASSMGATTPGMPTTPEKKI
jgi:hypothetical protein